MHLAKLDRSSYLSLNNDGTGGMGQVRSTYGSERQTNLGAINSCNFGKIKLNVSQ